MTDERQSVRDSVTYRAMSLEVRVAQLLAATGWKAAHSAWYRDLREQKDREIDVDAIRTWQYPRGESADYVRLHILAECKSVKGGQILFARSSVTPDEQLYFQWLNPDDDATREALFRTLAGGGVADREAARIVRRFHEAMYSEGQAPLQRFIPAPPAEPNRVTAGQEVQDGKRRFLWEASQRVYGAIEFTASELLADSLDEVRNRIPHGASEQRVMDECFAAMTSEAETLTLFHPVVVTDAHLWAFEPGGEPELVPSCRIMQRRIATALWRWIDVVHEDELTAWAERTTKWYADVFANVPPAPESPAATSAE